MADTIKSEIKESLIPATEEMSSVVIKPHGSDLAGLLRRFPEIADLLREATASHRWNRRRNSPSRKLTASPSMKPTRSAVMECCPYRRPPARWHADGALDICRKFEADLKHRLSPRIEAIVHDVAEPERPPS